jgi:hypothetical protein
VQSITIAPLTMKQGGCLPIEPPDVKPPSAMLIFARACTSTEFRSCGAGTGLCVPAAPGPEFKQCISFRGESILSKCPQEYPNRNVFYSEPTPTCSPCACDAPIGSGCSGSIDVSAGSACGAPLLPSIPINEKGATCVDVPPGAGLGSKSANDPHYYGGSCTPSGGKPLGVVFCCQP